MDPLKRDWAVFWLVVALFTGCLSREAKEAIADKTYAEEQLECVDHNPNRETIDACRRGVRVRWGVAETGRDAGHDR